jgi:hypothetical protein
VPGQDSSSDSQVLEARFPGYSWMPRWTRKYWTPQTALALGLAIFSAGSWVGTYLTAPDVRGLTKDITVLAKDVSDIKFTMGPACIRDCVLKSGDIADLKSHVNDLWKMRDSIDAELIREEALKKAAPPPIRKTPRKR